MVMESRKSIISHCLLVWHHQDSQALVYNAPLHSEDFKRDGNLDDAASAINDYFRRLQELSNASKLMKAERKTKKQERFAQYELLLEYFAEAETKSPITTIFVPNLKGFSVPQWYPARFKDRPGLEKVSWIRKMIP